MKNSNLNNSCENALTLYALAGMGHAGAYCTHGDYGRIADNERSWLYNSVDRSGSYRLCIKTHYDILLSQHPAYWIESINQISSEHLSIDYQGVEYPLDYYCFDESIVTPVRFSLDSVAESSSATYVAIAESQIPQTSTSYTSFCTMLSSKYGTLGFIGKNDTDSTQVTLNIGIADSDLNISWENAYTLNLQWKDGEVVLLGDSFPPDLRFDLVTQLLDGSWLVTVFPNVEFSEVSGKEINYTGTLSYSGEMNSDSEHYAQMNLSNCSDWFFKSIRTNRSKQVYPIMLYSTFLYESDKSYSFSNYYISRKVVDLPDIALIFGKAPMPCGRRFVNDLSTKDVWLKVNTTLLEHSAIIINDPTQSNVPSPSDFFSSWSITGFIGCQYDVSHTRFNLIYGSLDEYGIFIEAGAGTIQFFDIDGIVTVLSENLPTAWRFSPVTQQSDGSWLTTLNSI